MEDNGQVAIEYLLIFFVSVIILSIISVPLVITSIEDLNDVKDTMEVKDTLIELSNTARIIYSSDYGSMKTVSIKSPSDMNIYYKYTGGNHYIYSYVTLSSGKRKEVKVQTPCRISFNNKSTYYYVNLRNRWYYNTEVKWINSSTGVMSVNIYFK